MNPYIVPGLGKVFSLAPDEKKEELIREAINTYYGYESVLKRYGQNGSYNLPENVGRSVYVHLMKKYTKYNQQQIADFMGVHHTTVIFHKHKFDEPISIEYQEVVNKIKQILWTL